MICDGSVDRNSEVILVVCAFVYVSRARTGESWKPGVCSNFVLSLPMPNLL